MVKLSVEDIQYLLGTRAPALGISQDTVTSIVKEIQELAEEEQRIRDREKIKEQKKGAPYPILLATSYVPGLEDVPFFIVEAPESVEHTEVPALFSRAVAQYNQDLLRRRGKKRKRHKRNPIEELGEAMEHLPRTWLKGVNLKARFKVPCTVITTDNQLDLPALNEGPWEEPFDREAVEAEVREVQAAQASVRLEGGTLHIGPAEYEAPEDPAS